MSALQCGISCALKTLVCMCSFPSVWSSSLSCCCPVLKVAAQAPGFLWNPPWPQWAILKVFVLIPLCNARHQTIHYNVPHTVPRPFIFSTHLFSNDKTTFFCLMLQIQLVLVKLLWMDKWMNEWVKERARTSLPIFLYSIYAKTVWCRFVRVYALAGKRPEANIKCVAPT